MSDFIMVAGSSYRCGSTLVQRLLNNSGEATIYGEMSSMMTGFTELYSRQYNERTIARSDEQITQFENREDYFTANVLPDKKNFYGGVFNFLHYYLRADTPIIGFKSLFTPYEAGINLLRTGGKIIFVDRDVDDCYNSYKEIYGFITRGAFYTLYERTEGFKNILSYDEVFHLKYDEINEEKINELFDWCGIVNKDRVTETLNNKIREVPGYDRQKRIDDAKPNG